MGHVLEPATSGRAKCRACQRAIAQGELRFGERLPNPYAEGEMTLWFHPACAGFQRPEAVLALLAESPAAVPEELARAARTAASHRRLARIAGAERAPSSQAKCRLCHAPIEKASWRIRLVFWEEGRSTAGGFLHLACRREYFERDELEPVLAPLLHFSPALDEAERADLVRACN
jgi:poly(ADP-ribose) polymerase-like protein